MEATDSIGANKDLALSSSANEMCLIPNYRYKVEETNGVARMV